MGNTQRTIKIVPPLSPLRKGCRTLVLDLEDTLVGNFRLPRYPFHLAMYSKYPQSFRPHLADLLLYASQRYEVILWASGTQRNVEECVHYIHKVVGRNNIFDHVIWRDDKWFRLGHGGEHGYYYSKRLEQLGRNLDDLLIVDNAPLVQPYRNCLLVAQFEKVVTPYNLPASADLSLLNLMRLLQRWDAQPGMSVLELLENEYFAHRLDRVVRKHMNTRKPAPHFFLLSVPDGYVDEGARMLRGSTPPVLENDGVKVNAGGLDLRQIPQAKRNLQETPSVDEEHISDETVSDLEEDVVKPEKTTEAKAK
eukprot:PhF_6_TR19669/c0_g1_i1/m.28720